MLTPVNSQANKHVHSLVIQSNLLCSERDPAPRMRWFLIGLHCVSFRYK